MRLIAVIGSKNSGKTTVAEYLIGRLVAMGYRVGAMKHIHHEFTIDTQGKDTWRLTQAGASAVASIAPGEMAIIMRTEGRSRGYKEAIRMLDELKLDIAILEGFRDIVGKSSSVLKILTAKNMEELKALIAELSPPILAATGPIAEAKNNEGPFIIPLVSLKREGDRLMRMVLEGLRNQCRVGLVK